MRFGVGIGGGFGGGGGGTTLAVNAKMVRSIFCIRSSKVRRS